MVVVQAAGEALAAHSPVMVITVASGDRRLGLGDCAASLPGARFELPGAGLVGVVEGFCEGGFELGDGEAGAACPNVMVDTANSRTTKRPFFTRTSFQGTVICSASAKILA